jgi:hypothetical protein
MRRLIVALVVCGAGVAACVIGPKQDDPLDPVPTGDDASTVSDSGAYNAPDTVGDPAAATDGAADASGEKTDGAGTDAVSDATGDACPDGGVPVTAIGPWNDGKKCWKGMRVFECVSGIDGGAAETCFVEITTGDLYVAPSTHIPSGSNYRLCNEAERAKIGAGGGLCK